MFHPWYIGWPWNWLAGDVTCQRNDSVNTLSPASSDRNVYDRVAGILPPKKTSESQRWYPSRFAYSFHFISRFPLFWLWFNAKSLSRTWYALILVDLNPIMWVPLNSVQTSLYFLKKQTSWYNSGSDVFQASGGLATVGESQNRRVLESSNCVTRVGKVVWNPRMPKPQENRCRCVSFVLRHASTGFVSLGQDMTIASHLKKKIEKNNFLEHNFWLEPVNQQPRASQSGTQS